MKKIKNWDNVQEYVQFKNPVGGFICEIKKVEDNEEKSYLKIFYDITEAVTDDQKEFVGMYAKRKAERDFDYPATVVSYREDPEKPVIIQMFKGFTTAVENSNAGYTWNWDEQSLVGKKIGFVIGEEEYEGKDKDGVTPKVKVRTYVYSRRSVDSIRNGDFKVPEFKKLAQKPVSATPNPFANNGSAPAKVVESGVTDNTDPFSAMDSSECPF